MKVLVSHEKIGRFRRSEFVRSDRKLSTTAPCIEKLAELKNLNEDKVRIWHIDEDKQLLKIQLNNNGKKVFAEGGSMLYMGKEIKAYPSKVLIDRENIISDLFLQIFINEYKGVGEVAFAGSVPGELAAVLIEPGETVIAQRTAWIAGIGDLDITIKPQKLDAGTIFGVEDLLPQKFTNKGTVDGCLFFNACGGYELICLKEDETIRVEVGSLIAREESVSSDEKISSIKSGLFGGEGMFMIYLKGPGSVILQTTNIRKIQNLMKEHLDLAMPPFMLMNLARKGVRKNISNFLFGK